MPVWYDAARPLVEAGRLRVIGITQEQHADRTQLYAQWKGYDFPILWDPFNLTRSTAVPMAMGVDGGAVLRQRRVDARSTGKLEEFVGAEWSHRARGPAQPYPGITLAVAESGEHGRSPSSVREAGIARLLFHRVLHGTPPNAEAFTWALGKMGQAHAEGSGAQSRFQLGVAHRLRYDSPHFEATDFQASLDAWLAALIENPGQYIWRRRIQQWGPRLDKPYPFYDWVSTARAEVAARGETPIAVTVPLTGSEVAAATKEIPKREHEDVHPDPGGKLPRDARGLVRVEAAIALHTGVTSKRVREPLGTSRVHLVLRPNAERDVHWGNEAGPARVWVEVPEGWNVRRQLWTLPLPETVSSSEVRRLDFEIRPPAAPPGPPTGPPAPAAIRGVVFYPVCEGQSGSCNLWAQPFEIAVPMPAMGGTDGEEDR